MSSGFNTDVRIGDQLFHIQTEDRGPTHPTIDTAVYQQGRVLYRRTSSYDHFAGSPEFSAEDMQVRVEEHHRAVIEDLRDGLLAEEIAAAAEKAKAAGGIQVQLLNPESWLSAKNVSLDIEASRRADGQPQAGVDVEAMIEGALDPRRYTGTSDDRGRVHIEFPLPPLGKGDLALVILARADAAKDEIRFALRSRQKTP